MLKRIVLSLVLCQLFINFQVCLGESPKDLDLMDLLSNGKDEAVVRKDLISWMKRKSKKYMEAIGEKWIVGEKFNERQINCLLDKGKCDQEMEMIKGTLVSALKDGCATCSDDDKSTAGEALLVLLSRQPEVWKKIIRRFLEKNSSTHKLEEWVH